MIPAQVLVHSYLCRYSFVGTYRPSLVIQDLVSLPTEKAVIEFPTPGTGLFGRQPRNWRPLLRIPVLDHLVFEPE
jgi:hypothetical protein